MSNTKISFLASNEPKVIDAAERLKTKYGNCALSEAAVIVALGGDGFMLGTLHDNMNRGVASLRHEFWHSRVFDE